MRTKIGTGGTLVRVLWLPPPLQLAAPAAPSRLNAMYDSAACPAAGCGLMPRSEGRRMGLTDVDDDDDTDDADRCNEDDRCRVGVPCSQRQWWSASQTVEAGCDNIIAH
jgi:hypothetical protein